MDIPSRDSAIIEAVQRGEPRLQVAAAFGLTRSRIGQILRDGPGKGRHAGKPERNAEILAARQRGASLGAIAKALGLSRQRVYQICRGQQPVTITTTLRSANLIHEILGKPPLSGQQPEKSSRSGIDHANAGLHTASRARGHEHES